MLFKDKIIAAIKAKYHAINLSKKRLDAIAAKIEEKVIDDETKIDAALDTFNEYNPIAEIAKQDDITRGLEAKVKAVATPKKDDKTETPQKPAAEEAADDGTPAWAKALIEQNKTLAQDLAAIKGEKAANSMRSKATEKLKDIPASYWGKWPLPEKDEDLDAFVADVETGYQALTKDLTDQGLAVMQIPKTGGGVNGGGGGADKNSKVVSPEVKAYVEQQKAAAQAQAAAKKVL